MSRVRDVIHHVHYPERALYRKYSSLALEARSTIGHVYRDRQTPLSWDVESALGEAASVLCLRVPLDDAVQAMVKVIDAGGPAALATPWRHGIHGASDE